MNNSLKLKLSTLFPVVISFFFSGNCFGFGVSPYFGSMKEHAQITRLALACDSVFEPANKPEVCFDPETGSNLYSYKFSDFAASLISTGNFSAVEAPDNAVTHLSGGPPWWHCDDADHVENSTYPQSQQKAWENLLECRRWAQKKIGNGLDKKHKLCEAKGYATISYDCYGAAARSHLMITNGKINVNQPGFHGVSTFIPGTGDCNYDGSSGRIKCNILENLGYSFHTIQDFYSHSNYADTTDYSFSIDTPYGLNNSIIPDFWDLTQEEVSVMRIPKGLLTGCFPDSSCGNRITHTKLNKDNAPIEENGNTDGARALFLSESYRGAMRINGVKNNERAVKMAIRATRKAWNDFQKLVIAKEGIDRANMIICAIASDQPNKCTSSGKKRNALLARTADFSSMNAESGPVWLAKNNASLMSGEIIQYRYKDPSIVKSDPNWIGCGNRTFLIGSKRITLSSIYVKSSTCDNAFRLLNIYQKYLNGSERLISALPTGFYCMVMPANQSSFDGKDGAICKSDEDEKFEINLVPSCEQGDCSQ